MSGGQIPEQVPRILHLGSGKDYRPDWLNLDIEARTNPDVVFDLSQPLPEGPLPSARFGPVQLGPGCFDAIVANDVLEHIHDLVAVMSNCLTLLAEGGVMHVQVPYDLSYGAWQDPTHVRAFNEKSFLYYCEWFWYLGWQTHRFDRQKLDLVPSDLGRSLLAEGQSQELVCRTPRAIDALQVELVKIPLSETDKQAAVQSTQGRWAVNGPS